MSRLAVADRDQVAEIYRESYALWGAGLSRADYLALWDDIAATRWAERHARFYVWLDDHGALLSSLKLYRPQIRLFGRTARSAVIGAVFTPRRQRRRGHAAALMRRVLEDAAAEGNPLSLLFSDIGADYYASMGYQLLPAEEQWGTLRGNEGDAGNLTLRSMEAGDREDVQHAHDCFCGGRPIAIVRDAEHWDFLRARSDSFFARVRNLEVRYRNRVVLDGGSFVGYLVTVEGRGEWNVREVGAVDGDVTMMARIVRFGAAEAFAAGMRRFYGWLPRELVEQLGGVDIRSRRRRGALPMLLPFGQAPDLRALERPGAAFLPYQDQF